VRASSGMIGTTRLPTAGFFISVVSMRTKAIVVEGCSAFEPPSNYFTFPRVGAAIRAPAAPGLTLVQIEIRARAGPRLSAISACATRIWNSDASPRF